MRKTTKTKGRNPAESHVARFDRVALKRVVKEKDIQLMTLMEALRLNGVTTQIHAIVSGARTPSGSTVALIATLLEEPIGTFYKIRKVRDLDAAKKSLDSRPGRGRPKKPQE